MSWNRASLEQKVEGILRLVFGLEPGEIDVEQSFAEDLMAESLDYVDIELHVRNAFNIPFDFAKAAEEIRGGDTFPIRVRDLIDYLERRVVHAGS